MWGQCSVVLQVCTIDLPAWLPIKTRRQCRRVDTQGLNGTYSSSEDNWLCRVANCQIIGVLSIPWRNIPKDHHHENWCQGNLATFYQWNVWLPAILGIRNRRYKLSKSPGSSASSECTGIHPKGGRLCRSGSSRQYWIYFECFSRLCRWGMRRNSLSASLKRKILLKSRDIEILFRYEALLELNIIYCSAVVFWLPAFTLIFIFIYLFVIS